MAEMTDEELNQLMNSVGPYVEKPDASTPQDTSPTPPQNPSGPSESTKLYDLDSGSDSDFLSREDKAHLLNMRGGDPEAEAKAQRESAFVRTAADAASDALAAESSGGGSTGAPGGMGDLKSTKEGLSTAQSIGGEALAQDSVDGQHGEIKASGFESEKLSGLGEKQETVGRQQKAATAGAKALASPEEAAVEYALEGASYNSEALVDRKDQQVDKIKHPFSTGKDVLTGKTNIQEEHQKDMDLAGEVVVDGALRFAEDLSGKEKGELIENEKTKKAKKVTGFDYSERRAEEKLEELEEEKGPGALDEESGAGISLEQDSAERLQEESSHSDLDYNVAGASKPSQSMSAGDEGDSDQDGGEGQKAPSKGGSKDSGLKGKKGGLVKALAPFLAILILMLLIFMSTSTSVSTSASRMNNARSTMFNAIEEAGGEGDEDDGREAKGSNKGSTPGSADVGVSQNLATTGWVRPADTSVSDVGGEDIGSPRPLGCSGSGCTRKHMGIDFGAGGRVNEVPIYAAARGKVSYWGPYGTGGNTIKIDHGAGIYTHYLHLEADGARVSVGEMVDKGQLIGYMGGTNAPGYSRYAPHLHFEVADMSFNSQYDWNPYHLINPHDFLESKGVKNVRMGETGSSKDTTDSDSSSSKSKGKVTAGNPDIKYKLPATSGFTGYEDPIINEEGYINAGERVSAASIVKDNFAGAKYYIAMRWTAWGWSWDGHTKSADPEQAGWIYKGPRLVHVTNPRTGKSIIAPVLESGPAPWAGAPGSQQSQWRGSGDGFVVGTPSWYTGRVAGLAPEAYKYLEAEQGMSNGSGDVLEYAWAADQNAKPGPTDASIAPEGVGDGYVTLDPTRRNMWRGEFSLWDPAAVMETNGPEGNVKNIKPSKNLTAQQLARIVKDVKEQVGKPYVPGGNGPEVFDCSGLVKWAFAKNGYQIQDRTANLQIKNADQIVIPFKQGLLTDADYAKMNPGDLIGYSRNGSYEYEDLHHITIYIGDGQMVHASNPTRGVVLDDVYNYGEYITVVRY